MKKDNRNSPLEIKISNGQLVVSVGVDTLAWATDYNNGGPLDGCSVKTGSEEEWAKDVAREMEEEGHGFNVSTRVGTFLDQMIEYAYERGSAAIERKG